MGFLFQRTRGAGDGRMGVAVAIALAIMNTAVQANPVKQLDGYWTGTGTVKLNNGSSEQVKCVVTYRVDPQGTAIRQSLRCASAAYKINGKADFKVAGQAVTGQWEETNYAATGEVTGRLLDQGFTLMIKAPTFSAEMKVGTAACKQTIDIEPKGLDVAKINISLSKC
jgi:hypothetical protein